MEENKTWVNPNIRVIWEDHPENITQDKIKDVRQYFARKYGTTNVNVITKVKYEDKVLQSIDVSSNILDINYQNNLIKNLLETNSNLDYYDKIMEINNIVENKLVLENQEPTQFNKWYIKRIRFSNFLSFGENQELDFDKLNGITIVESTPQNTGGKTTLTIDLLLFLFFNTTTKSSKAEDIFNKFTNKDTVQVVGDIIIDGEEYMISRRMDRKKNKTEEWKVKSELSFDKKLKNGEIQNLKGEQRRETELFIKNTIGNMDDFLATILTTGNNLEDLLESKPTARGQLLGRFLGLEHLKKKEDFGKEVYQEFSKRMFSNVYNVEKLKTENLDLVEEVKELEINLEKLNKDLKDYEERLEKGNQYKNELYTSKYSDIDKELLIVNVQSLETEIATINANNFRINDMIKAINSDKPENFYDEDEHDILKENIMDTKLNKQLLKAKIDEITKKVEEAQKASDAANTNADALARVQATATQSAEAATKEAQIQAAEAVAVKAESVAKTAAATKAVAAATVAAKVATAAKEAAAKVPAAAKVIPKASTSTNKNSATATVTGLKPGQKVKVTVNVRPKS
jgi:DNA repair exonuclease SbcCD ATPase subunit